VPRELETYTGEEIRIHDDRGICSHAGYCTDGLPRVFRQGKEPWIDPNGATIEEIIETIRKCPSGALSYTVNGQKHDEFSDFEGIHLREDGPYVVRGNIELHSDDHPQTMDHYSLCRCGKSKNKPFCNGEHWYEGFEDKGRVEQDFMEKYVREELSFDNRYKMVKHLAETGETLNSSMRTLESFPDFKALMFKGAQLNRMPVNEDTAVNLQTVIGKKAKKPLKLSIPFYVSHMSFGAISEEAKIALAEGSALMDTAMCSGEGGMLPESRTAAKHYIYELGTAASTHDEASIKKADAVELKIGQGVKPGLGGHLPGHKVTEKIAKIRNLAPGEESSAPGRFAGVDNLRDLDKKVQWIREIADGVPVGIKISTGDLEADLACALAVEPDFITIDCRGGATGSSPKILKDNVGIPPIFAIRRARTLLDQMNSEVTLCATGGFRDSADIAKGLALGADAVALATASLISIGCIQARICHTGNCPAGITTQDETYRALFNKKEGVRKFVSFYSATAKELAMFARTNGKRDIHQLNVDDLMTINNEVSLNTDIPHV